MKRSLFTATLIGLCLAAIAPPDSYAQKKKKKSKQEEAAGNGKKKQDKIKPYGEVITNEAITDEGLFTTHKVENKYYFEMADSLLEREILVVSRISGTIENFNFGGAGMKARGQQVWRFQKKDNKILLRSVSYNSVADEDKPIYQSVVNNNFEPVVAALDIAAFSPDSSAYVVKVNSLFEEDVPMIGPMSNEKRKQLGVKALDKNRSLIVYTKSFPLNTEVRHILTYKADKLPANQSTESLSMEMNQSMVLLPKEPMQPRMYDQRVGFFSIEQIDYGLDEQKAAKRRYITRWRLEPKDEEAFKRGELVEPVKPIVYYIDPSTPIKWRKYIKQGIEDWQEAFEGAGFKNAILAKDPPTKEEDPDWSPEDVRYSVVRYTANPIQNAMGPHVHDPRSGEIIESDIIWYHNVMNLLRNWYFIQTAAVNEEARKVKFDDAIMGELIRFVSAHEVGHTLGFPHNMGASYSYPVDSLRSPSFTEKMGTAPSIMDYARFNYVAQPGDNAALYPQIGVYDKWAVKWGYSPILSASSPEEEKETLDQWIKENDDDQMYWYGRQTRNPIDPRAQTEDLGDNAMKASTYGVANLKRIINDLVEWTEEDGKDYEDLDELYNQVLVQWGRYNRHVRTNIGGVYETYKTYDQEGVVYNVTPKNLQRDAMNWLQKETFSTPTWMINSDILQRIEHAGAVNRIREYQVATLNAILDESRLARLIESEAIYGSEAYSALEMMDDLREGIWSELSSGREIDTYRRNLQRAYIERMEHLMTKEQDKPNNNVRRFVGFTEIDVSQSDIRPLVRGQLNTLKDSIQRSILRQANNRMSKYHLEDALKRIEVLLEGEKN